MGKLFVTVFACDVNAIQQKPDVMGPNYLFSFDLL